MTKYMNHKMEELDIPSVREFVEMIADTGAGLYACKASVDLFGLEKNGWSVAVVGRAEEVTDPGAIARLSGQRHVLWQPGESSRWVRIVPEKVTGRRIGAVVN